MQYPRVIIAGGSLGGLTAAMALRDAGCDVQVFERSRTPLSGLGAGIVLNPATVRVLIDQPGFDLDAISITSRVVRYMGNDGSIVHERECQYRFSSYNVLHSELINHFDADRYQLGTAVDGFAQSDDGVLVALSDERSIECDLLVCADGIRSTARRLLYPELAPSYAGYVAVRGTIAPGEISPATFGLMREAITYRVLPHSHLLTYPIPFVDSSSDGIQVQINWLWYRNVDVGARLDALMTDREGVRRDLSLPPGMMRDNAVAKLHTDAMQLPPPLRELVWATQRPFIQQIVDLEVPKMAFDRVCLIGDAAFVARPHAAAGTAKAAEDAWTLARAICTARGHVCEALQHWEPSQLQLGRSLVARTREAGYRSQMVNNWHIGDPLPFGLHAVGDSAMQ